MFEDTYHNITSCKEFIVAMAEIARGEIEVELIHAPFVSISADSSIGSLTKIVNRASIEECGDNWPQAVS